MAHLLHLDLPPDLRLQARRAHHLATAVAPGHGRPIEDSVSPAARPRDPADARPVSTRAPATASGAGPWPPSAAPRPRQDAGCLVAGRALRVPAGWACGPPFPRPAAAGVAAVVESSQGVRGEHTTIESSTPRRRDAHPTRAPPTRHSGTSIGPDDLAGATTDVPRVGHLGLTRRSYQIVSTTSSSVILRSRVTRGRPSAIAVALMRRSHGSPSASRGIR